jgi:diguanylate cyclase (GGDEF)-like protein
MNAEAIQPAERPGGGQMPAGALARAVSWFALGIATIVALAPPIGYFALRYTHETANAELKVQMIAGQINELISRNPETWKLKFPRLNELIAPLALNSAPGEKRTLTDIGGYVVIEVQLPDGFAPGIPVLRRTASVVDQGNAVGEIEIVRTLRPMVLTGIEVGVVSLIFALCDFAALRLLPLRLLHRAIDRAAWLGSHDPLTGLPNRSLFRDRLEEALANARRDGATVGVLYLDLDHFKEVNDTLGHPAGDKLLREVAKRLSAGLRETDTLSRLGGDEFAVVQSRASQPHAAERLASRMIALLARPFDLDGHQVSISGSLGIVLLQLGEADPSQLQREADLALYQAKGEGDPPVLTE